jgi:hypothetical protein
VSAELFSFSIVQPLWLDRVLASYDTNAHVQSLLQKLAIDPASDPHFTLRNGLLRYDNRIWLGVDPQLHRQVISVFHDSPVGSHSGFPVTYRKLVSLFKWPGMKATVRDFVRCCRVCQQAKPERLLPAGLL